MDRALRLIFLQNSLSSPWVSCQQDTLYDAVICHVFEDASRDTSNRLQEIQHSI